MKKVLIPTDFSAYSKNAMRYALALFQATPCHFYLLNCHVDGSDYREKPIYGYGTNILVEKEPKKIDQKLENLEISLKSISRSKSMHHFTTLHEKDYFLKSIRRHIAENNIELIVMGTP